jgi:hypothetical protein
VFVCFAALILAACHDGGHFSSGGASTAGSPLTKTLSHTNARKNRQVQLVARLNAGFNCRIHINNEGERLTFARELGDAKCTAVAGGDYRLASELLEQLAQASLPEEAGGLDRLSRQYQEVGPEISRLKEIRQKLFDSQILSGEDANLSVHFVGHPFSKENRIQWLESYVHGVDQLNQKLRSFGFSFSAGGCPEPACDPAILAVAQAVTTHPPLEWFYFRQAESPVAPSAFGLSWFQDRFSFAPELQKALGLEVDRWPKPEPDALISYLRSDGTLIFPNVLDSLKLAVTDWQSRTEFPNSLPLFYLFQEAQRIASSADLRDHGIDEIRFELFEKDRPLVTVGEEEERRVLHIRALQACDQGNVSELRQEILRQIPGLL